MSGAIAILVKTPGHSPIKTRLAVTEGIAFAQTWHSRAAAAVAAVVRDAAQRVDVTPYWAVAEHAALDAARWSGFATIAQVDGTLGARMAAVHRTLTERHGFAILLGADAPQLRVGELLDASAWLAAPRARLALGPARDGGFWLFGGNRVVPDNVWTTVTYSAADTAATFRAAFAAFGEWRHGSALTDLDRVEDMPAVIAELAALPAPLPEQAALTAWLLQRRDASDPEASA